MSSALNVQRTRSGTGREPSTARRNDVSISELFLEHWTNIDAESMARYEMMYRWSAAGEVFYRAAEIGNGQVVADFGCGPGHTAVEFARRVGPTGHVHALDINAEFIA